MNTGIFIRAQINGQWMSIDIGDKTLSNEQFLEWLHSKGGKGGYEEQLILLLLERKQ